MSRPRRRAARAPAREPVRASGPTQEPPGSTGSAATAKRPTPRAFACEPRNASTCRIDGQVQPGDATALPEQGRPGLRVPHADLVEGGPGHLLPREATRECRLRTERFEQSDGREHGLPLRSGIERAAGQPQHPRGQQHGRRQGENPSHPACASSVDPKREDPAGVTGGVPFCTGCAGDASVRGGPAVRPDTDRPARIRRPTWLLRLRRPCRSSPWPEGSPGCGGRSRSSPWTPRASPGRCRRPDRRPPARRTGRPRR